jgi:glutathione S-transferase
MKLYFSPGACSLSPHIVLREAGLSFDLDRVNGKTKVTASGIDFRTKNPNGYVPTLELDDGQTLTEGPAIVQFIADKKPESKLAPPPGSFERVRLQELLNFIGTELHKGFGPLFNPKTPDEYKAMQKEKLSERIGYAATVLGNKTYLMGDTFTVADAYLFTVLRWTAFVGLDLGTWPTLKEYSARIEARPAVKTALEAETASKRE